MQALEYATCSRLRSSLPGVSLNWLASESGVSEWSAPGTASTPAMLSPTLSSTATRSLSKRRRCPDCAARSACRAACRDACSCCNSAWISLNSSTASCQRAAGTPATARASADCSAGKPLRSSSRRLPASTPCL